jgi:hypothetical protein
VAPLAEATGRSLLPLCEGRRQEGRDAVFLERERHANVRRGDASYPIRAIRTRDYLYIQNLRPERWPAGDPELYFAVGPYGDIDPSPTKTLLMENRERFPEAFRLCFEKRPAEELYDLRRDPGQVRNVAGDAGYARTVRDLGRRLKGWREATADPRLGRDDDTFDAMPYYGPRRGAGV